MFAFGSDGTVPRMSDPAAAWAALDEPWRVCFELAWEAYGAGTIPVGAALVDGEGAIVAAGRNRVYEGEAPAPQIARSLLAHAEVNTLIGLDPERRYEDHVLYSSLEPCVLCVGATVMATVGRVRFAGADPYGAGHVGPNPHVERVPLQFEGPRDDGFGMLFSALLPAFYLRRNPDGAVVATYAERMPEMLAVARRLLDAGVPELAAQGGAIEEALPRIWAALAG
jgi:tRNA(Arg) A34 adenosine deaminase TadA